MKASASASAAPEPVAPTRSGASAPRPGYVGEDTPVARATLRFGTPAENDAYDTLHACLQRDEPDWYAYPLRRFGNFVNVAWCRGKGADINCEGGDLRTTPGAAWTELEVLHHDSDWPRVFGLSFRVGQLPAEGGIGVALAGAEGGGRILGDLLSVTFFEVAGGAVTTQLHVGMTDAFAVGVEPIEVHASGTRVALWQALHASPESLRREVEQRLEALERAVTGALAADTPRKCVYGPSAGGGIAPPCLRKVPLDASEKRAAAEKLNAYLTPRRALVASQSDALHARLLEVLPARCWSPRS